MGGFAPMRARHEICRVEFVEAGSIHAHRVGIEVVAFDSARERSDHARIHAAGEIRADGHIRAEPLFDSAHEQPLKFIHERFRLAIDLVAEIGKIHRPIRALLDGALPSPGVTRRKCPAPRSRTPSKHVVGPGSAENVNT